MNLRKTLGDNAERSACRFLCRHGLELITANYRCRRGELDLIMRDGDSLVFVEVRYRRSAEFGHASETISRTKQARIIHCARCYLSRYKAWNEAARFDVVCIEGRSGEEQIEWLKNAFGAAN
ncbi:MAG: YraN family protein [Thiogranum sp.]|nr:YraN family protein [Thiogranum sp.]